MYEKLTAEKAENDCRECAADHRQLAAWLTELKELREENKVLISECDRLIKEKGELLSKVSGTVEAADVQPVKRGKWEHEHYNEQIECYVSNCSECGYESTDKYRITSNHRYCEYCGARMDGEQNE